MRKFLFFLSLFSVLSLNAQTKEKFYPDGYYFPQTTIKIKNWEFDWLSIFIEPSKDYKPSVSLRLSDPKTGKFNNVESHRYSILKDSTVISFSSKSLGELTLRGRYTISKPPFDNKEVKKNTIVFIGNFTVNNITHPVKFTWGEGD